MSEPWQPLDSAGRPALGRADVARVLAGWTEQERYELCRRWVARYLPLWHEAYARYADAAGIADEKRTLHTQRMGELVERCQQLRDGVRMPKARVNETESAISALTEMAPRILVGPPWSTVVRNAALTARYFVALSRDGASLDRVAASVYRWAEVESGFPGRSDWLLQQLTPAERARAGDGHFDGHHLLYARPCRDAGLEAEGRAVYDAVADIMGRLDEDPGPFLVDDEFFTPRPAA
ncbi:hypothetical protein RDV89_19635 [Nocardioides zeae]|uniref:Uncharacterized protein n=1 Tax=Nocardioides imazamoxiresistens TaxID=3231893 RepID=A0ABU3Q1U3_9ACTN|nr:hypothetical protein [Nocardioides zeae]MDT9595309.1 hypothetical protein [Nocardioides zeae]